jgi:hypothetical protein
MTAMRKCKEAVHRMCAITVELIFIQLRKRIFLI